MLGDWTNQGTITNSGQLFLGETFSSDADGAAILNHGGSVSLNGTVINAGKTLTISDSIGNLILDFGTISGGRVETSGNAMLTAAFGNYLSGVTLAQFLTITGNVSTHGTGCILMVHRSPKQSDRASIRQT